MTAGKRSATVILVLLEDSIRQPALSASVQRYQLAIDDAKMRLDLAVSTGTWFMPSRMVINTGSTVAYNNQLKQAKPGMKKGVNNDVNTGTKRVGQAHGLRPAENRPANKSSVQPSSQSSCAVE